ncbi:ribonuclease HI [Niabella aurantiaca]|uniref:ribonuclease HI n=1 Tax=Niabella aurantiaca TaxID=379900 RepID=UPI0003A12EE8|nr:ribonuclease HI [Niabella aurantiaca]
MQSRGVIIYTDGASRGNPGPGGYGVVLMYGKHIKELSAGFKRTTNNRMELMAVIEGIRALKTAALPVTVYSDSQYVVNAVTKGWLNNWVRTDFKGGKKNKDLWMQYYQLAKQFQVRFVWVKGHADNPYNNRCDALATAAADGNGLTEDLGFEG